LSSLTLVGIILHLSYGWGEVGGDLEIPPKIIVQIWGISNVSLIFDNFHTGAYFLWAIYLGLLIPYTNDEPAWVVLAKKSPSERMVWIAHVG